MKNFSFGDLKICGLNENPLLFLERLNPGKGNPVPCELLDEFGCYVHPICVILLFFSISDCIEVCRALFGVLRPWVGSDDVSVELLLNLVPL